MTSNARAGRRRRMLHDGASPTANVASRGETSELAPRVRYTPRPGSASFAVATSVLPRSPLALVAVVVVMAGSVAALAFANRFSVGLTTANAGVARLLTLAQPGSLAAWYEAALWLAVSIQSLLLFGVRRQRTDDTRSAYRWWIVVALVALGMSVNSATHAHVAVAAQVAAATGFSPLAGDAFWWLAPGALLLGGVLTRSLLEIKESPLAAFFGIVGVTVGAVGWLVAAGMTPSVVVESAPLIGSPQFAPLAVLVAVSLACFTLLLYSRRIVREAAGEIEAPVAAPKLAEKTIEKPPVEEAAKRRAKSTSTRERTKSSRPAEPKPETAEPEIVPTRAAKRASRQAALEAAEEADRWVSGGEGYDEEAYDEGPNRRKLSKAERKRLRREKARRAA